MTGATPLSNDYAGYYYFLVQATDIKGGPSTYDTFTFYIDKNRKPNTVSVADYDLTRGVSGGDLNSGNINSLILNSKCSDT